MWYSLFYFLLGALGYGALEIVARGYTHWTMLLAGGICLLGLRQIALRLPRWPLPAQAALGAGLITAVELAFGLVCNRMLGWQVWDYSTHWCNLWGQVCPLFTFFWFLLCLPLLWALNRAADTGVERH